MYTFQSIVLILCKINYKLNFIFTGNDTFPVNMKIYIKFIKITHVY